MTAGKLGWHWTAKGWKRTPKHLKTVKKIATPPTRKIHKMQCVAAAKVGDVPTFQQARRLAAAKLAAAQFLAAVSKDVRRHRLGNYAALEKPTTEKRLPPVDLTPFANYFADKADDLLDEITDHIAAYRQTAPKATMNEAVAYVQSLDPVLDAFLSWKVRGEDWLTDPLAQRLRSLFTGFAPPAKSQLH